MSLVGSIVKCALRGKERTGDEVPYGLSRERSRHLRSTAVNRAQRQAL